MDVISLAAAKKFGMKANVFKYQGSCTFENLPTHDNEVGDVWNVTDSFTLDGQHYDAGTNVAWDGEGWDALAASVDLSNYVTHTDYAAPSVGGVIKIGGIGQTNVDGSGCLFAITKTYSDYVNTLNGNGFISKGTLENVIAGKGLQTQYGTMPTADANTLGKIIQYIGATNQNYTNGYYYECVSDGAVTPVYSWEQKDVQPAPVITTATSAQIQALFSTGGGE